MTATPTNEADQKLMSVATAAPTIPQAVAARSSAPDSQAPAPPATASVLIKASPFKASGGPISPQEEQRLLDALEKRLTKCERFVGDTSQVLANVHTQKDEEEKNKEDDLLSLIVRDDKESDWIEEVVSSVGDHQPLLQQVKRLEQLTQQVFSGKMAEFERMYNNLKELLVAEHAYVSQILLTAEAKRAYILASESRLEQAVQMLKQLDDLKDCINAPGLTGLSEYTDRLARIQQKGFVISKHLTQMKEEIQSLALEYNSVMNMVSLLLLQRAKKEKLNPKNRKGVAFAA